MGGKKEKKAENVNHEKVKEKKVKEKKVPVFLTISEPLKSTISFSADEAEKCMQAVVDKKAVKAKILFQSNLIQVKKKGIFSKKPNTGPWGFKNIQHFYQFNSKPLYVTIALSLNSIRKYIVCKFADIDMAKTFCNKLQKASLTLNNNLENEIPPAAIRPVSPSVLSTSLRSRSLSASSIKLEQVNAAHSLTSESSSTKSLSRSSSKQSITSEKQLASPTKIETKHSQDSQSELIDELLPPVLAEPVISTSVEQPNLLISKSSFMVCENCKSRSMSQISTATSPAFKGAGRSRTSSSSSSSSTNSDPKYKKTRTQSYDSSDRSVSSKLDAKAKSSRKETLLYIDPVQSQNLTPYKNVNQHKKTSRISRSSSSSSSISSGPVVKPIPLYSQNKIVRRSSSLESLSKKNLYIVASGKLQPFSTIAQGNTHALSTLHKCSICGTTKNTSLRNIDIIKTDVRDQPKLSSRGTVYMFSSTHPNNKTALDDEKKLKKQKNYKVIEKESPKLMLQRVMSGSSSSSSSSNEDVRVTKLKYN